jgi:hypothetical protein
MLKRVIGLAHNIIRLVGRVLPLAVSQNGGDSNTAEQIKPAHQKSKRKHKAVNRDTQEPSHLQETLLAPTLINPLQASGMSLAALALQPAQSKQNKKQSAAQSTTQVVSPNKGKRSAQVVNGEAGKQRKTPAKGIVQRAKRANKPKR